MDLKKFIFFSGILLFSYSSLFAQQTWRGEYNRLGLQAGANYFDIVTDYLPVSGKVSWTAGFTARASVYKEFQVVYGINFYDMNVDIEGREKIELSSPNGPIEYNMIGVQANIFGSFKIIDHFLTVEAGPVLQLNGRLEPRQDKELWYVSDYNIQAIDIEKVSPFNVNLAAGLTGGFEKVKFWVQYQHGVSNILGGLNDEGLEEKDASFRAVSGNMRMIVAGVVMFL